MVLRKDNAIRSYPRLIGGVFLRVLRTRKPCAETIDRRVGKFRRRKFGLRAPYMMSGLFAQSQLHRMRKQACTRLLCVYVYGSALSVVFIRCLLTKLSLGSFQLTRRYLTNNESRVVKRPSYYSPRFLEKSGSLLARRTVVSSILSLLTLVVSSMRG